MNYKIHSLLVLSSVHFRNSFRCATSSAIPVVTVPTYMKHSLKSLQMKQELKRIEELRRNSRIGNVKYPIIKCKRSQFNHYLDQTYAKHEKIALASQSWKHRKSVGDYFTIYGYGKNPSIAINEEATFASLKLKECIIQKLENLGLQKPTVIQSLAIPDILQGRNVLLSAETGSGKTIAYMAPIIHHLNDMQDFIMEKLPRNCPLALIMVPSRELAEQIGEVTKKLVDNINVKVLLGGHYRENKADAFNNTILIATLGTLETFVRRKIYDVSHARYVVIDEADTLLDDSFNRTLKVILRNIMFQAEVPRDVMSLTGTQLILSSATYPKYAAEVLSNMVDITTLQTITTSHLHRVVPHVPQKFHRVKGTERTGLLIELVKSDLKQKKPVMIFCNRTETNVWMSCFLNDMGVPNVSINGNMPLEVRAGRFEKFQKGECNVLTCTDIASRGLDTVRVKHVINFDFPKHMSDYIHRVGRTGRLGSPDGCHVTNFIFMRQDVELLNKIEMAVRCSKILPNVDANIKRQVNSHIGYDDEDDLPITDD